RLGVEAADVVGRRQLPREDHLQGDDAVEAPLAGLSNDPHAPPGDLLQQLVIPQVTHLPPPCPDGGRPRPPRVGHPPPTPHGPPAGRPGGARQTAPARPGWRRPRAARRPGRGGGPGPPPGPASRRPRRPAGSPPALPPAAARARSVRRCRTTWLTPVLVAIRV